MALCKTAVTSLLTHKSYCSLVLSHRYEIWPTPKVLISLQMGVLWNDRKPSDIFDMASLLIFSFMRKLVSGRSSIWTVNYNSCGIFLTFVKHATMICINIFCRNNKLVYVSECQNIRHPDILICWLNYYHKRRYSAFTFGWFCTCDINFDISENCSIIVCIMNNTR